MSRKPRLSLALNCVLLIIIGVIFWTDYSRRAFEGAVDSASQTKDVPVLIRALGSNDERLRRKAAEAIAKIGPEAKAAVPALIDALSKEDTSFTYANHTAVLYAIGSIGPDAKPAVPHLVNLLDQQDAPGFTDSRESAVINTLGRIGPAANAAIPALLEQLKRDDLLFSEKHATINALAKIGPTTPDVVAAFMETIENEPVFVTQVIVEALGMMGPPAKESVNGYIDKLFDQVARGDGFVRLKEAGGAKYFVPIEMQTKLESLGGLATPLIRAGLKDDREPVRVISAYILVDQGESSSEVVKVLIGALDKPWYRGGAVGALTKLGPAAREALPSLRSLAANVAPDSSFKTMLEEAIQAIDGDPKDAPTHLDPK